jgi:hypothetical protein
MLVTQRLNGLLLLKNLKKKTARKKSRKFGRTSQIRTGDLYHVNINAYSDVHDSTQMYT